jgi:hypothetical protein
MKIYTHPVCILHPTTTTTAAAAAAAATAIKYKEIH